MFDLVVASDIVIYVHRLFRFMGDFMTNFMKEHMTSAMAPVAQSSPTPSERRKTRRVDFDELELEKGIAASVHNGRYDLRCTCILTLTLLARTDKQSSPDWDPPYDGVKEPVTPVKRTSTVSKGKGREVVRKR